MKISELAARSGVPVPTIKYYVREGLLPPGELTSPNQAQYDESHIQRLKLVRALVDVGGLSIAATRQVLEDIDSPDNTLHVTLGKVQYALSSKRPEPAEDSVSEQALARVNELIERRGWQVGENNPARQTLVELLATIEELGRPDLLELLDGYAELAERTAALDVAELAKRGDGDSRLETAAIWIVLGDAIAAALRRLAQEHSSAQGLAGRRHT